MSKLFTASWCVNCAPIKKYIEENKLSVEVLDVDDNVPLVRASGVRSVPSLLLGDGTVVVGSKEILETIKELYGTATNSN